MELGGETASIPSVVVHMHSSENMSEVADGAAKLFMGPSVFLGKGVPWSEYAKLYDTVYNKEGRRILRSDGVFVVIQTNAYADGEFICRYRLLLDVLDAGGWQLLDERVWQRRRADHFQLPFSHVLIFIPPGGTMRRAALNKNTDWFQGVWNYPQTKGGPHAGYPAELCRLLVNACTGPGDLIVDPFAGTAQLLAVAADNDRRAIGYEIDDALLPIIHGNGVATLKDGTLTVPAKRGFFNG